MNEYESSTVRTCNISDCSHFDDLNRFCWLSWRYVVKDAVCYHHLRKEDN